MMTTGDSFYGGLYPYQYPYQPYGGSICPSCGNRVSTIYSVVSTTFPYTPKHRKPGPALLKGMS